jgi:hypothetical protein
VTITLANAKFVAISANTVATGWFTNLPSNLAAKVKNAVLLNDNSVIITIEGIPTTAGTDQATVEIPGNMLVSGMALPVTGNISVLIENPPAGEKTAEEKAADLATELGGGPNATANNSIVTVTGNVRNDTGITVPDGVTLTVGGGGTLTVGGTITGDGDVTTDGDGSISLANADPDVNGANLAFALGQSGIEKLTLETAATLAAGALVSENLALTLDEALTVSGSGTTLTIGTGTTYPTIDGTGNIITTSSGTIEINSVAYTTVDIGALGSGITAAAAALVADVAVLTNKPNINLQTVFYTTDGDSTAVPGIGSTAGQAANTSALAIEADDNGADDSSNVITLGVATTLVTGGLTATGEGITGDDAGDLSSASFTLSLESNQALSIADGSNTGSDAKVGIVTFTGVKLANGGLVTPALPAFKVGVKTKHT